MSSDERIGYCVECPLSTRLKEKEARYAALKELEGYAIRATDGTIGHVRDFYFDDEPWVIRYFIIDTGAWLWSRKALLSPIAIGHPNWSERALFVSVTKAQAKDRPDIDAELPVSSQHEIRRLRYYG